jgi:hypothetical protein
LSSGFLNPSQVDFPLLDLTDKACEVELFSTLQGASSRCGHLTPPAKWLNTLDMLCQVGNGQSSCLVKLISQPVTSGVFHPILDLTDEVCQKEHVPAWQGASSGYPHMSCPATSRNALDMCYHVGNWLLTCPVKWICLSVTSGFSHFST